MQAEYRTFLREGEQAAFRYGLASPRRLPRGMSGNILGSGAGSSLEFLDHREYQPGDDLRHIDWNAYARSDKLTVKLFREEISPQCDLLIDGSRSMALEDTAKTRATLALTALLGQASFNADCSLRTWWATDICRPVQNGHERPTVWEGLEFPFAGNIGDTLLRLPPQWRSNGIRFFVSDLLWSADPLPIVMRFAEKAAAFFVVQILAEADVAPAPRGNIRLMDTETGIEKDVFLDDQVLQEYQEGLRRHQQEWSRACSQVGGRMVTLIAENLLRDWDLKDLVEAEMLKVS